MTPYFSDGSVFMLNSKRQLAELVRILEERAYIFPADPAQMTEVLRDVEEEAETKLLRRAEMIDRNQQLQDTLVQIRSGAFWLWVFAATLVFASGFSATYVLMDSQGLNFFLILASVLGLNTVMLGLWLLSLGLRLKFGQMAHHPMSWFRGKDPVNQAVLRLLAEEWQQPSTRWKIGQTSHSLWLATLLGMLTSILLLLVVRQYTFNWESTLLTNAASVKAIAWLSWLPAHMGFPVPDAAAVLKGRLNSNIADAHAWAGLLIGSIICYGILPRGIAWAVCKIMLVLKQTPLPLAKPYYQKIIQQWQNKVIDADNQCEPFAVVSPKIIINQAEKWAVMLETEWPDPTWFVHTLGQDWLDKGNIISRHHLHALLAELQQQPVQLLIGVRIHTVPDRGILRQITQLAEAAKGGAVVQLLAEAAFSDGLTDNLQHWQNALGERQLAWLNPPRWNQEIRTQQKAV